MDYLLVSQVLINVSQAKIGLIPWIQCGSKCIYWREVPPRQSGESTLWASLRFQVIATWHLYVVSFFQSKSDPWFKLATGWMMASIEVIIQRNIYQLMKPPSYMYTLWRAMDRKNSAQVSVYVMHSAWTDSSSLCFFLDGTGWLYYLMTASGLKYVMKVWGVVDILIHYLDDYLLICENQ